MTHHYDLVVQNPFYDMFMHIMMVRMCMPSVCGATSSSVITYTASAKQWLRKQGSITDRKIGSHADVAR
ncbi:hypothetical protein L208DRAFT_1401865 [Tricholoma matsutake]|nr:hypothetical protein L208DRAFT_1401865 [Tricholoma matsutake 945]